MAECKFIKSWIGPCKKETQGNRSYCEDHILEVCCSCKAPATHECEETMGLVCGMPLCNNCEHKIEYDGTNARNLGHCRKDEQEYKPWYMGEKI